MNVTSRYEALGMPLPNSKTMCKGDCEGTGYYPVWWHVLIPGSSNFSTHPTEEPTEEEQQLWLKEHNRAHTLIFKLTTFWDWLTHGTFSIWSCIRYLFESKKCDGWHFIKCSDCNGTGKRI